jgi:hypothetical protein
MKIIDSSEQIEKLLDDEKAFAKKVIKMINISFQNDGTYRIRSVGIKNKLERLGLLFYIINDTCETK